MSPQALPLRSPPANDPRPDPLSPEVVSRALDGGRSVLEAWTKLRPTLSAEALDHAIAVAVRRAGFDAFRAGLILHQEFSIPVDDGFYLILRDMVGRLKFTCRVVTGEWVVRTGLRFPGRDGQTLEWINDNGARVAGKVYAVNKVLATATMIRATDERAEVILCEQVIANLDEQRYTPERPVLGAHYEDACAAQVAVTNGEPAPLPTSFASGVFPPTRTGLIPRLGALTYIRPNISISAVEDVPTHIEPQPNCTRCDDTGMYANPHVGGESLCDCGAETPWPPDDPAIA